MPAAAIVEVRGKDPLVAFLSFSPSEMLVVAVVALLLFGGKLPEVARTWGRTFAEFRRNLSGIQDEINEAIYAEPERIEYKPSSSSPSSSSSSSASVVDPDYPEGPLDDGPLETDTADGDATAVKATDEADDVDPPRD